MFYIINVNFNIILTAMQTFLIWNFPFTFVSKNFLRISPSHNSCLKFNLYQIFIN
jgi:hypothetical protein